MSCLSSKNLRRDMHERMLLKSLPVGPSFIEGMNRLVPVNKWDVLASFSKAP